MNTLGISRSSRRDPLGNKKDSVVILGTPLAIFQLMKICEYALEDGCHTETFRDLVLGGVASTMCVAVSDDQPYADMEERMSALHAGL